MIGVLCTQEKNKFIGYWYVYCYGRRANWPELANGDIIIV